MPVGEDSCNKEFEQLKEERDTLLEGLNAYKIEKTKLEKTLLENKVAMKPITRSLVDLERSVIRLETEMSLEMKTNKGILSYSSQAAMSGCRVTYKLLENVPSMYFEPTFSVEKVVLKNCRREDFGLVPPIPEQRRN